MSASISSPPPPSPLYASLPRKWTRCLILALARAVTRPSLGRSLNGTHSVDPSSHNLMFVKVPEQTSTEQLKGKDVWGDGHREGKNEVTSSHCKLHLQQILNTGRCLGLSPESSSMFWARTVSSGWSSLPLSPLLSRWKFCKEGNFYEVLE